ncbi:substrate-binding domain-containing protein [Mediannikoviicoccus vaginalis]|uniref:substrate-binding domain-containing protein n=1 Tax=Mediannikoviicoccus vaginalis TaxID=2899727 RepID=UPI001F20505E|nr:substrate-binding domain-containing protein [Mediannikoviicoccus vaginalis]
MKGKFKFLGILLAVTLLFTACGKGGSDTDSTEGAGNDTTATEEAGNETSGGMEGMISVVSREEGSGTRGAFVELVKVEDADGNDATSVEAVIQNNTEAVVTTVAGEKSAIGYISLGSLNDTVKALKVDDVEATAENVANGSYKIARPFNIVTKEEPTGAEADFIGFILSEEGQKIVEEEGYVKSPEAKDYTPDESAAGSIAIAGSSSVTPIMEKLVEAYGKINPNVKIQVNMSDSTTGVQSVKDGIAQIGMASRELKESEQDLNKVVIAMDGIAVVVNKDNSVENISLDNLKSVYLGEIENWEDVK